MNEIQVSQGEIQDVHSILNSVLRGSVLAASLPLRVIEVGRTYLPNLLYQIVSRVDPSITFEQMKSMTTEEIKDVISKYNPQVGAREPETLEFLVIVLALMVGGILFIRSLGRD